MTSFDISGSFMQRIGKRQIKWVTPAHTECRNGWVRPSRVYDPKLNDVFRLSVWLLKCFWWECSLLSNVIVHPNIALISSTGACVCVIVLVYQPRFPGSTLPSPRGWFVMQRSCLFKVDKLMGMLLGHLQRRECNALAKCLRERVDWYSQWKWIPRVRSREQLPVCNST